MKKFRLDKRNAILLGVCSGLAGFTGLNATLVRIGVIAITLLGAFPWTLIAYGVAAWLAKPEGWRGETGGSLGGPEAGPQHRDQRLADVDRYVAAPNSSLAREIDSLR